MHYNKVWALINGSKQWHVPPGNEVILGWVCETRLGYDAERTGYYPLTLVPSF